MQYGIKRTKRVFSFFLICSIIFAHIVLFAQSPVRNIDYYVQKANSNSPLLKDLDNQKKIVKIDSLIAKASAGFQVMGSSSGVYAPNVQGFGFDKVLTNGQALDALITVNYELLNKNRLKNQLEAIKIQHDSVQYASLLAKYDIKKTVIDQYITVFSSQQQVDFNKDLVNVMQKEEQVLKQLTRSNIYKQSEYLTFLVTLKQQQLALKQAEIQYKNDFANLNYLSGQVDTVLVRLEEPKLESSFRHLSKSFFNNRFDIDSLKNNNQKLSVALNYKPRLNIYVNGGYNSSLVLQPYKNFGTSIGFTFSIPIYDGQQKKMQYNKLKLNSNTISYYRDYFALQQNQQLNLIKQQILAIEPLLIEINEQIRLAKGLIDVDTRLLRTGDIKMTDFVIAINNYMNADNLLKQNKISHLKLINQFNYWNK